MKGEQAKMYLPPNWPRPQLLAVVGSHAYGLATETSDWDYKGFYVAPSEDFWRLRVPNEQYQATGLGPRKLLDVTLWEVGKYLHLCLQGNPSVLEVLYAEDYEVTSQVADEIRKVREIFLSKKVAASYKGYASSQIGKSKRDVKRGGELRPKSLMHCMRLLLTCKEILQGGNVRVHVGPHLELLRKIRAEEISRDDALQMCEDLFDEIDGFRDSSVLPDEPDKEAAERLLLWIRAENHRERADALLALRKSQ